MEAATAAVEARAPASGYLRINQIVGQKAVTLEEALENKRAGSGPTRPRPAIAPLIPVSESGWWAGVKSGRYPKPVKLSPRVTVWRVEDIQEVLRTGATKAAA